MTFYIFWMLCAVLAANVVVAFIAITKASTTKGDLSFPNSETGTNYGGDIAKVTALKFSPK